MATKLDGALKRELTVSGEPYVLAITSEGFKLVPKGKRKGYAMAWQAFVSGDEALATAGAAKTAGKRRAMRRGGRLIGDTNQSATPSLLSRRTTSAAAKFGVVEPVPFAHRTTFPLLIVKGKLAAAAYWMPHP